MANIVGFVKDSIEEMRHKVTWPKAKELRSSSILVLIGAIIFALIIGVMDFTFDYVMGWFYQSN